MTLAPLPSLSQLTAPPSLADRPSAGVPADGFGRVLNGLLAQNTTAQASADEAVRAVATGEAQDLHTVSLAVAKADLSFRLILELRNRLAEVVSEVTRMQV
jgi:flagellar hook-basal body complex protein FliE